MNTPFEARGNWSMIYERQTPPPGLWWRRDAEADIN